jgi:hypothetical protein
MTLLQKLSLAATLSSATFSVAASIPQAIQKTIQPDNVVVCEPNAGCVNKTLFGRSYKVITTPRFTVMVSISNEGVYTRADVSITNHTDTSLSMTPEDFRVEVVTPKPKVLLYVSPANVTLPPPPVARAARGPQPATPAHQAFVTSAPQPTTPAAADTDTPTSQPTDVEALYAVAEQNAARQEAAEKAAAEKPLSAASIAPNEVTRGRVYFERDKKSHLVNVVLPIAGLVFEFPYAMKH